MTLTRRRVLMRSVHAGDGADGSYGGASASVRVRYFMSPPLLIPNLDSWIPALPSARRNSMQCQWFVCLTTCRRHAVFLPSATGDVPAILQVA
jgi:hypothetical protein